jgi:hypothetical protein
MDWLPNKRFTLLYKASRYFASPYRNVTKGIGFIILFLFRNGFEIATFHERCDLPGTLAIIQSTDGYLFGGYTSVSWQANKDYKEDPTAFIFTLSNPNCIPPTKYTQWEQKKEYAIYCAIDKFGFGGGHDICIFSNNSNQNSLSHTNFPYTYIDSTGKGINTFNGTKNFMTRDIEVYSVIPM